MLLHPIADRLDPRSALIAALRVAELLFGKRDKLCRVAIARIEQIFDRLSRKAMRAHG